MYIILDTETTGADAEDRICQLAFIVCDENLNIIEHHCEFCHPAVPIKYAAMAVHHITHEMVENAPLIKQTKAYKRLEKLNNSQNTLVIHNAPFDLEMLEKDGFENKMQLLDTLRCMRHLYPQNESNALQFLRYSFGLYQKEGRVTKSLHVNIQAHDALGDVVVLYLLLQYLLTATNEKTLIEKTSSPVFVSKLRFGKYKGRSIEEVLREDYGYITWLLNNHENAKEAADLQYTVEILLKKNNFEPFLRFSVGK